MPDKYSKQHSITEAMRYIASDPSDPFLRNRVLSHIHSGIAEPGDYTAEVTAGDNGRPVYTSMKRL